MTTVVYRDGVIAADSLVTSNETVEGFVEKSFYHAGYFYGYAGNLAQCFMVRESFIINGKAPEIDGEKNFGFFRVDRHGAISFLDSPDYIWVPIKADYYAIGSGREIAIGALAMGATARQAVEIAVSHDVYSGGEIAELHISKDDT